MAGESRLGWMRLGDVSLGAVPTPHLHLPPFRDAVTVLKVEKRRYQVTAERRAFAAKAERRGVRVKREKREFIVKLQQ